MLRHIVMFKLSESITPEERKAQLQEAFDLTKDFKADIPTLVDFQLVTNSDQAPVSNYDIALICDFDSIEGLDQYQEHPTHLKFGAFIHKIRESRACIDFEI
ncbi:MAG: Dabb family protein [Lachnospiraceae bacterium]